MGEEPPAVGGSEAVCVAGKFITGDSSSFKLKNGSVMQAFVVSVTEGKQGRKY